MNVYVKNILLALAILVALVFVVLRGLDVYTRHGKQVLVPDVRGMQVEQAASLFGQRSLLWEVVDSLYVRNKAAGSILETVPPVETHVKEGRKIYLIINALSVQMLTVPQVTDMSQRQAEAILRSLGFERVRVRVVPGIYKDLVVGLQTSAGAPLEAGSQVPVDVSLVLLVGSGQAETMVPDDEVDMPGEDREDLVF
jgi:beta-lactam-binding protein with PASTA domain